MKRGGGLCAALLVILMLPSTSPLHAPLRVPSRTLYVSRRVLPSPLCHEAVATGPGGGRPHTPESRAKISAANKGRVPWNSGRKHSEETRRRIAEGTRRAMLRKAQEKHEAREKLRAEDPEAFQKLVEEEEKAEAEAEAAARAKRKARQELRAQAAAQRRQQRRTEQDSTINATSGRKVRRARVSTGGGRVNFTFTAESRARISESLRRRWQDPEYRARRANATVGPETRARLSAAMKAKWADGTYRRRVTVNGSHSEERRAKIAASIRAKWTDPDYRQRATAGIRQAHASGAARGGSQKTISDEARKKISETMKRRWSDEGFRADKLKAMEARAPACTRLHMRHAAQAMVGCHPPVHSPTWSAGRWEARLRVRFWPLQESQSRRRVDKPESTSAPKRNRGRPAHAITTKASAAMSATQETEAASHEPEGSVVWPEDAEPEAETDGLIAWGDTIIDFGEGDGMDGTG